MVNTTETTLKGSKLWIVVGVLGFVGILYLIGCFVPDARTYVETAAKTLLGAISSVGSMK